MAGLLTFADGTTPAMRETLRNLAASGGSTGGIGGSLRGDLASGETRMNSAVGAAQSGLNAILGIGGQIRADSNAMRNQAGLVNAQAGALNNTANAIIANADSLRPMADKLTGYGDDLWGRGEALWDQANDAFGQASSLALMDPNATGLAGEYLRMYGYLSPDRYVSQAASDVQGAYANANAQAQRDLQRKGVSTGSGASEALRKQLTQSLATALAAAKTKARQTGIDQQSAYLNTITDATNKFYNMGKDSASQALATQGAAADAQLGAAGIVKDIGSQYSSAGSLQGQAGTLYTNAATIFGNAGSLDLNYARSVQSGYAGLTSAYTAAANYYLGAADRSLRGSGGGGVKITQAPEDDWMNWKGTGHSQTWNANNLPTDVYNELLLK